MINDHNKIVVALFIMLQFINGALAQSTFESIDIGTNSSPRGYWEFLPSEYKSDSQKTFPVVIFLHGLGAGGDGLSDSDLPALLGKGPPLIVKQNIQENPFAENQVIMLAPQITTRTWWTQSHIRSFLDFALSNYRIDERRIYLTGLSAGSYGIHDFMNKDVNADQVTAILTSAVRGRVSEEGSYLSEVVPYWGLTARYDASETVLDSVNRMAGALQHSDATNVMSSYPNGTDQHYTASHHPLTGWTWQQSTEVPEGKNPLLTIYPGSAHHTWGITYDNPSVWSWMFAQVKPEIIINTPVAGSRVFESNLRLSAAAYDDHSNFLTNIRWYSDKDGFLGNGNDINVELSSGEHQIKVQAIDDKFRGNTKHIDLIVDDNIFFQDTDSDGISDSEELAVSMNPNNSDTDGDQILDGIEGTTSDSDGDGVIDALESSIIDTDNDGLVDQYDPNNNVPVLKGRRIKLLDFATPKQVSLRYSKGVKAFSLNTENDTTVLAFEPSAWAQLKLRPENPLFAPTLSRTVRLTIDVMKSSGKLIRPTITVRKVGESESIKLPLTNLDCSQYLLCTGKQRLEASIDSDDFYQIESIDFGGRKFDDDSRETEIVLKSLSALSTAENYFHTNIPRIETLGDEHVLLSNVKKYTKLIINTAIFSNQTKGGDSDLANSAVVVTNSVNAPKQVEFAIDNTENFYSSEWTDSPDELPAEITLDIDLKDVKNIDRLLFRPILNGATLDISLSQDNETFYSVFFADHNELENWESKEVTLENEQAVQYVRFTFSRPSIKESEKYLVGMGEIDIFEKPEALINGIIPLSTSDLNKAVLQTEQKIVMHPGNNRYVINRINDLPLGYYTTKVVITDENGNLLKESVREFIVK